MTYSNQYSKNLDRKESQNDWYRLTRLDSYPWRSRKASQYARYWNAWRSDVQFSRGFSNAPNPSIKIVGNILLTQNAKPCKYLPNKGIIFDRINENDRSFLLQQRLPDRNGTRAGLLNLISVHSRRYVMLKGLLILVICVCFF